MWYYLLKFSISAAIIVAVSEVSKRYATLGGLLASLPLISILGMSWLYVDTRDAGKVAALSWSVLWLVIPTLPFFVALPLLLKRLPFAASMVLAILVMLPFYGLALALLKRFGAGE